MRDPGKWRPTRVVKDPRTGRFVTGRRNVFGGSLYIADLQHEHYIPLLQEHITGNVLDVACGRVPYYEVYGPRMTGNTCLDWAGSAHGTELVDVFFDLNVPGPLPFGENTFDSAVASDMIMHLKYPDRFMNELFRVLKPGGCAFLSTPYIYWNSEAPHEYFHASEWGLERMARDAGFEVVHLTSYGGHADVLMDTLNKFFHSGLANRLFLAFAAMVKRMGWPRRDRARTRERYALGYCMVVRKPGQPPSP